MRSTGTRPIRTLSIIAGTARFKGGIGANDLRTREFQIDIRIDPDSTKQSIRFLDLLLREPLPFGF